MKCLSVVHDIIQSILSNFHYIGILALTTVGMINGYVCQTGDRHGIDTPFNDKVVEIVTAIGEGQLPLSMDNLELFEPAWFTFPAIP